MQGRYGTWKFRARIMRNGHTYRGPLRATQKEAAKVYHTIAFEANVPEILSNPVDEEFGIMRR